MSEHDAGRGPEHFAMERVEATEPERLPPAAHAACEPEDDELDTDVELADEDEPTDHSGQYEV
jgi:hypothetical protein